MRSPVLAPLLVTLAGCGSTGIVPKIPSAQVASEIEAKLRTVPCVGSIHRWERHYEFRSKPSILAGLLTLGTSYRWFDYGTVEVGLYQAGFGEFRPLQVRENGVPGTWFDTDDREYAVVFGHYNLRTRTLRLWACGPNMGGKPDAKIVVR